LFDFIIGSLSYGLNEAMQVLIGCSLYSVQKGGDANQDNTQIVVLVVEVSLTLIVSVFMGYYANTMVSEKLLEHDRLNKMMKEEDEESQSLLESTKEKSKNTLSIA
jgi:NhaP-type Na+/H+ and K+/H+ antiporter